MMTPTPHSKRLLATLTTRRGYFSLSPFPRRGKVARREAAGRMGGGGIKLHLGRSTLLHLFALLPGLVDRADHVEGLLRQVVVLAVQDLLETADRLVDRNRLALASREPLGDVEWLRQEALDLARPRHGLLVVLRQLLHAQDGDDVLQVLVTLHRFLHALRGVVVILSHD